MATIFSPRNIQMLGLGIVQPASPRCLCWTVRLACVLADIVGPLGPSLDSPELKGGDRSVPKARLARIKMNGTLRQFLAVKRELLRMMEMLEVSTHRCGEAWTSLKHPCSTPAVRNEYRQRVTVGNRSRAADVAS